MARGCVRGAYVHECSVRHLDMLLASAGSLNEYPRASPCSVGRDEANYLLSLV